MEGPSHIPFILFGVFFVIFVMIFIGILIKICMKLDRRRSTKITRRPHQKNSYENLRQTVAPSATAPLATSEITIGDGDLGIDDIVVISDPNEASPVVVPPYPVEPRHPTPHVAAPAPGFTTHNPPYPTQTPHPVPVPFFYPPSMGAAPYPPVGSTPYPSGGVPYPPAGAAPYPPAGNTAPYPEYGAHPPSYSEAVSQPPVQPLPPKEGYSKQAPYNPNY